MVPNTLFCIDMEEHAALLAEATVQQSLDLGSVLLQLCQHAQYGPILTVSNFLSEQCAWMVM
jgi:hypothetical protein